MSEKSEKVLCIHNLGRNKGYWCMLPLRCPTAVKVPCGKSSKSAKASKKLDFNQSNGVMLWKTDCIGNDQTRLCSKPAGGTFTF